MGTTLPNDDANYLVIAETLISNSRRTLSFEKLLRQKKGFADQNRCCRCHERAAVWRSGKGVPSGGNWVIGESDPAVSRDIFMCDFAAVFV